MKVGVCSLKSYSFRKELLESVINTGFAVITQHDIDIDLILYCQKGWREFFKSSQQLKNVFVNGNNTNMGYKSIGTETAVGASVADLKEFFHYKPGEAIPDELRVMTDELFSRLSVLGMTILSVLEQNADANYVNECQNSPTTLFRTIYYPALSAVDGQNGAVRSAAHEDINHITLLVAASAPGLQVKDINGNWFDVPHEENSITVNIGDILEICWNWLLKDFINLRHIES